ncbi:ABC transporter permease, partial [Neobacillus niacini]|uniref:ABC transporter permease n=1 Tax=Neobacillus niacini TaxID=86668 RepID=UPI0030019BDB
IVLMILAVLMPIYAHVSENGFKSFFIFLFVLLIMKAWNIAVNWRIHYYVQPSVYIWDMVVRYFINALFTFLVFNNANVLFLLIFIFIMAAYYWSFFVKTRKMGLKWDLLITQEEKRMASFYRLANLFTDVPKLKDTVKRRKWLDLFINQISFSQENTYHYLFARTFLRSSDYLGLFIRLTVIGAVVLYFISFGVGQLVLSLLFIYLTGFQLLPLSNHHQNKLWIDLYPVSLKHKTNAFQSILLTILYIQSSIFTIIILVKGEWLFSVIVLLSGILFSFLFVNVYSKKRLKI